MITAMFAVGLREWLRSLSNGEATVLGVVLTFSITVAGWLLRRLWRRRQERKQARQAEAKLRRQEVEADFLNGPVPMGIIDHEVTSSESLNTISALIVRSIPTIRALDAEDIRRRHDSSVGG